MSTYPKCWNKCRIFQFLQITVQKSESENHCGGATRPLPRDGGVEELHGDPTAAPTSRRLNVVVRSLPL